MNAPSASELLAAWEQGVGQPPVRQALSLLSLACPETPTGCLPELSLGRRDTHLLALRERLFGPRLAGRVDCPACGERLEVSVQTTDLRVAPASGPADSESHALQVGEYALTFRLPNSLDLQTITSETDTSSGRLRLLDRIVLSARCAGQEVAARQLTESVVAALNERLAQADPQADLQLDLRCPQCAQQWFATFDVAAFLWEELRAWATRLLREVHELASAYGWSEADILALSPTRRQAYLDLTRA